MTTEELKKEAEEYLKQKLEERKDKFVFELPEVYIEDVKEAYLASAEPREKRIAELEKENAELKAEWQEQVQKATDEGYARTLQTIQLTKAKDHIKKLLDCLKQDTNDPQTNYYVCQYMDKAEQFLKESEVEK